MFMQEKIGDQQCVVVFTCRGKQRMLDEGGSEAWRIDASRASKCKYVVCVQNRNETWGQATAPHKHAFLIAEISEITDSVANPRRQAIKFKSYADLNVPDSWDGNRNPVAYARLSDFGINTLDDLEDLSFCRLGARFSLGDSPEVPESPGDDYQAAAAACDEADDCSEMLPDASGLSFAAAKRAIAIRYGVSPDQIEILIRA